MWGKQFEKEFDYYTTDLDKFLNDEKIDVVYIGLPNALHYEYAMKALKHGKHVILEKPFTVHYDESKKLIDYAKKHKLFSINRGFNFIYKINEDGTFTNKRVKPEEIESYINNGWTKGRILNNLKKNQ